VNLNENQVRDALVASGLRFSRNSQFARRFVDFYIHAHGACIEVDGREHNVAYDELRDIWLFKQGILVFRMKNGDEARLAEIVAKIASCSGATKRKQAISRMYVAKWWKNDQLLSAIWDRYRKILDPSRT
jgi:very-short-patch-repair endonuclease